MEVQPAYVKTRGRDPGDSRPLVDRNLAGAHPMPDRDDAERNRPIAGVLPDRSIPVVHELVAVVFEFLAKIIQHRPGLMTGGAAEAVLPGERRKGVRILVAQGKEDQNQTD